MAARKGADDVTDAEDRKLLERWAAGDNRAGDKLTVRYFKRVRRYFHHRVPGEHEDLMAETFLQLSKSVGRYRGDAPVRVFIFRIARNVLLMHLRKLSRQPQFDTYTTSLSAARGRRPSSLVAESEECRILLDAMQDIPIVHHDVLTFYYWDRLKGREIAALLDLPEGTVRNRIRRGLQLLLEAFNEHSGRAREWVMTEDLVEQRLRELKDLARQL